MNTKAAVKSICLIFFLAFFSPVSKSQISSVMARDSLTIQKPDSLVIPDYKFRLFGGLGSGYFMESNRDTVPGNDLFRSGLFGLEYRFVISGSWGGSLNYKAAIHKSDNVPADYYDDGLRLFAPKDYFEIISLNLVKEFSNSKKTLKYGLEAGPSWVNYSVAEITPNPDYDPEKFMSFLYWKTHNREQAVGALFRARVDYWPIPYLGFELAAFTTLNKVKPGFGFDLHIMVGNIRSAMYIDKMKREQEKK
jgi:hypothetical protein